MEIPRETLEAVIAVLDRGRWNLSLPEMEQLILLRTDLGRYLMSMPEAEEALQA
jgi:hypothetical protein